MRLDALDHVDLERSWQRVLTWARGDIMDVPDRLPYELADRVWNSSPELSADHDIQAVQLVMATKVGTQTIRPFVRPHVRDMLLFHALMDALRDSIEGALPDRGTVFSYRVSSLEHDDAFDGSPRWRDFWTAAMSGVAAHPDAYVVRGDVSSFFLTVDLDRLQRDLLEIGADPVVVGDLSSLLYGWHHQGVRGLPQGLPATGPLANLYLRRLDDRLRSHATAYWRYSDDFVAVTDTFASARELLDLVERDLYEREMSLGSAKTSIRRARTVLGEFEGPEAELDETLRSLLEFADEYGPSDDDIREVRLDLLRGMFDEAVAKLETDFYPRRELTHALRGLARARDGHAVQRVPYVMTRMPGLTSECMRYLTKLRSNDASAVATAITAIVGQRFHRDQEWLHVLRAALHVKNRALAPVTNQFGELALSHPSPLVRGRALLAWGRHSRADDVSAAERFFQRERRMWLGYAIASLKAKSAAAREDLHGRWSSEGRSINRVIASLDERPLRWADM